MTGAVAGARLRVKVVRLPHAEGLPLPAYQSDGAAGMDRRQARTAEAERQLAGRAFLDADDYARVEERIDAATRLRRTYRALQHLREQDRRLLELIAVDGLSTGEAARVLSISPVAARVRLSRARGRLRMVLATAGEEEATSAPPVGSGPGRRVRIPCRT